MSFAFNGRDVVIPTPANLPGSGTFAIYVHKDTGDDTNDGLTSGTAVKTLRRAGELVLHQQITQNVVFVLDQTTPNDPWVRGDASMAFIPQVDNDNLAGFWFSHAVKIQGARTPIDATNPTVTVATGGVAATTDPTLVLLTLDEDITGSLVTGKTFVSQEFDGDYLYNVVDVDDVANTITVQDPSGFLSAGNSLELFASTTVFGDFTKILATSVVLQAIALDGTAIQIGSPEPSVTQQNVVRFNGVGLVGASTQVDLNNVRFESVQLANTGSSDLFFNGIGGNSLYAFPTAVCDLNFNQTGQLLTEVSLNGEVYVTVDVGSSLVLPTASNWVKTHNSTFFVLREGASVRDRAVIQSNGCARLARLYPGAVWHADNTTAQPASQSHTAEVFNLQEGAMAIDVKAKYSGTHTGVGNDFVMPNSGGAAWAAAPVTDANELARIS